MPKIANGVYVKDPDETNRFPISYTLPEGVTIEESEWIMPEGITKVDDTMTDSATELVASGGTLWQDYEPTNRITRSDGVITDTTITIIVRKT